MIPFLTETPLPTPYEYTDYVNQLHVMTTQVMVPIQIHNFHCEANLMVKNDYLNPQIEILLGQTFLDQVRPYQITEHGLHLTCNQQSYFIPYDK